MNGRNAILAGALFLCISGCVCGQTKLRVIHVFVALADNEHQGIVPVPATLGNGDDPAHNLYWGAAFGVRTFFRKSSDWKEVAFFPRLNAAVLERSVFEQDSSGVVMVADAYRGSEIKQAVTDFFRAAAGSGGEELLTVKTSGGSQRIPAKSDLVAYVGHDGLMDFQLTMDFAGATAASRSAIVLACASRSFFKDLMKQSGATPLLWTNGLMAPEAYTLKAALDGWIAQESNEQIRKRAAEAYAKYQRISDRAALRLFATDW